MTERIRSGERLRSWDQDPTCAKTTREEQKLKTMIGRKAWAGWRPSGGHECGFEQVVSGWW